MQIVYPFMLVQSARHGKIHLVGEGKQRGKTAVGCNQRITKQWKFEPNISTYSYNLFDMQVNRVRNSHNDIHVNRSSLCTRCFPDQVFLVDGRVIK